MFKKLTLVVSFFVVGIFAGCGEVNSSELPVSKEEFGDSWPLTVDSGYLECWKHNAVIFHSNGKTYAVNGTAIGWRRSEGWRDIEEIWADDPTPGYYKIDISPILDRGLTLC